MPTLLHLNGPSGVGKSTLARRYAEEHPGVLALDIDRVVAMIGGWQDDFSGTLRPARDLALVMAEHHLRSGRDVVVPQLVTSHDEVAGFERAAARAGAGYVEVALLVAPEEQRARFRAKSRTSGLEAGIEAVIDGAGGDAVLRRIHGHVDDYLTGRPAARRLATDGIGPEQAYAGLVALLG